MMRPRYESRLTQTNQIGARSVNEIILVRMNTNPRRMRFMCVRLLILACNRRMPLTPAAT